MAKLTGKHTGKWLMMVSAFMTATGQLFWKWGTSDFLYLGLGFLCYGIGAVLMLKAFALEKLSVAYPLMCISYAVALVYGDLFLGEDLTWKKTAAIALLGVGVTLTSYDD
ncbi:EamA family transporter [Paenibacillus aurantiacus]|uniref:EamA family transporter n=1 Tax=Paenibacillus aurantiacus TaxID=1936118 RepID=A0ABV5KT88_9BACL